MFSWNRLHKAERGQAALETAIILIAFVVVAAVFAFTILSAGNASTEKGKQAIAGGLANVQSSMNVKGSVIANSATGAVTTVVVDVSLVSGGSPVDLSSCMAGGAGTPTPTGNPLVISYRDTKIAANSLQCKAVFVGSNNKDSMLDSGEIAELTIDLTKDGSGTDLLTANKPVLSANSQFTLEVKPPTGAVITLTRTIPAALTAVMDLG